MLIILEVAYLVVSLSDKRNTFTSSVPALRLVVIPDFRKTDCLYIFIPTCSSCEDNTILILKTLCGCSGGGSIKI